MEQWIAGRHAVLEALRSGRPLNKIWIDRQVQASGIRSLESAARAAGVTVQYVDRRKLEEVAGQVRHQGVVAQAAAKAYADIPELLTAADSRGEPPLLLLLDEIEDPHNLGSMLRTAECAGAHGIVIPKRRSAGLSATVAKVSAGAVEHVPVARVTNLARAIDDLKEDGLWIAGADGEAEQTVYEADLTGPLAIVIGNEGKGLSRLVKQKCDFLIRLPMKGRIESLNASVAAGVILYEALRQRSGSVRSAWKKY